MSRIPLKVVIADDELVARKRLVRLLEAIEGVELVGVCEDAEGVLAQVRKGGVDVVLLDIQMPGLSGLDAVAMFPDDAPYVVFCTAHPEHALKAFDAGAIDYVLKPVEVARLAKALERAREREQVGRFRDELARHRPRAAAPATTERLPISTRQGIVLVHPQDVTHATLEDELVTLFTRTQRYLTDFTLQELQDKLAPFGFERVHRRALLHLDRVTRLVPQETGGFVAHTVGGETVEVSRQAARELRKRLGLRRAAEDEDGP